MFRVCVALAVLAVAAFTGGSSRAAGLRFAANSTIAPQISSNWSGYAAIAPDPVNAAVGFSDVTGTWVEPRARCTSGRTSSAAFWVGLGGYDESSTALEQLGTAADCDGTTATPLHYAWWELVPAASKRLPMKIMAGDTITAAVVVNGQSITFFLKDVTRHTRFSKVITTPETLDVSSAEWIAEAPSACSSFGSCRVIPLTNFGTVTFSKIAAIGNAHAGTLLDPAWSATPIELIANGDTGDRFFGGGDVLGPGVGAVPGDASSDGRAFSVSWAQNLMPPTPG
jgi:hypothetical protein